MRTPGKWYLDECLNLKTDAKDGFAIATINDPCRVGAGGDLESNAALLVAAPDLLEAAKEMVAATVVSDVPNMLAALGNLRAAIMKAEPP